MSKSFTAADLALAREALALPSSRSLDERVARAIADARTLERRARVQSVAEEDRHA
jgi:hypothetical protein